MELVQRTIIVLEPSSVLVGTVCGSLAGAITVPLILRTFLGVFALEETVTVLLEDAGVGP